jgi:hypothetical protein
VQYRQFVRDNLVGEFETAQSAVWKAGFKNKGRSAMEWQLSASRLSRRAMLGATAVLAAGPALAEECRLGPAPHEKGAHVFMDMDQQELDASYDQLAYEPLLSQITKRLASNSEAMRARIGAPERESYGQSAAEGLDIYRTKQNERR